MRELAKVDLFLWLKRHRGLGRRQGRVRARIGTTLSQCAHARARSEELFSLCIVRFSLVCESDKNQCLGFSPRVFAGTRTSVPMAQTEIPSWASSGPSFLHHLPSNNSECFLKSSGDVWVPLGGESSNSWLQVGNGVWPDCLVIFTTPAPFFFPFFFSCLFFPAETH